jgi:hypothetical protein
MKQTQLFVALVILAVVGLGCGSPTASPVPVATLRPTFTPMSSATSTLPPTPTTVPTDAPPPTVTPPPPTDTAEPPTPVPPTDTPVLPSPTPVPPTATQAPPKPTRVPPTQVPPTQPPASQPEHVVGSHGVSGLVVARDKTTFAVGEKAFFTYEALNHTSDPVDFVLLGIKASDGQFNTSWINPDVIVPGQPFRHDDGLTFNSPGTYKVMLAICFARCGEANADWEEFPKGAATITVQ